MDCEVPREGEEGQGHTKVVHGWGLASYWFNLKQNWVFTFSSSPSPFTISRKHHSGLPEVSWEVAGGGYGRRH